MKNKSVTLRFPVYKPLKNIVSKPGAASSVFETGEITLSVYAPEDTRSEDIERSIKYAVQEILNDYPE